MVVMGSLLSRWVVDKRSLQPSSAKTADGSIPLNIFKSLGLECSWVLLFCLCAKCDDLFWAPSKVVHHKEVFPDHLLYLFATNGHGKELSFFSSWFPIALLMCLANTWAIP